MAFLEIQNLTKAFGGLRANDNISFSLERQELIGLIGPNGAGWKCSIGVISETRDHFAGSVCHLLTRQGCKRRW